MKLRFIVKGVGVFLDDEAKQKWQDKIWKKINNQLKGFNSDTQESDIIQEMYIHDYDNLDLSKEKPVIVVPDSSNYQDGLFVEMEIGLAYKIEKNELTLWVDESAWLSMPFLLHLLFKQREMMFVHGAGISLKSKGILMLGFGGIGKTSFISEAVKDEDVKVYGDDMLLINREGQLQSYARPFCLYEYHKVLFPNYFRKHKVVFKKYKIKGLIIQLIKKVLGMKLGKDSNYVTVSPVDLFSSERIGEQVVPLAQIYIVSRYKNLDEVKVRSGIRVEEATNFAVNVMMHEWYSLAKQTFNRLALENQSLSNYFRFYEEVANECFKKADEIQAIDIPEKLSAEEVSKALAKIVLG